MHLGALISRLENEQDATEAIEAMGELVLYVEVAATADLYQERPSEYLAASGGRFAATADDAEWLGLVSAMGQADDPGQVALCRILRWAVARDREDLEAKAYT